jgi:hypothetical protein
MILSRFGDGKVYYWQLNASRSKLLSERHLVKDAGPIALSDNGFWIAVVAKSEGQKPCVQVFYEGHTEQLSAEEPLPDPVPVFSLPTNPQAMAIQQQGVENNVVVGHLALAETVYEGMSSPPPIEIYSISSDGQSSMIYRLKVPSPCTQLIFCHGVVSHLVSNHADGLTVFYDLLRGKTSMCHGSPTTSCLSISPDRTLVVATENDCFRVFRLPSIEDRSTST